MKLFYLLPLVSAEWNVWQPYEFCDYDQQLVSEEYSEDPTYGMNDCKEFCRKVAQQNSGTFYFGDALCCDYE